MAIGALAATGRFTLARGVLLTVVACLIADFVWFELGRTEWIRAHGVTYRQFEDQGILLPAVHAACDYKGSARYDDLVRVETTVTTLTRARVGFAYRVLRVEPGPEALLVEGRTEHVFLSREGRLVRLDRQSPFWTTLSEAVVARGGEVRG